MFLILFKKLLMISVCYSDFLDIRFDKLVILSPKLLILNRIAILNLEISNFSLFCSIMLLLSPELGSILFSISYIVFEFSYIFKIRSILMFCIINNSTHGMETTRTDTPKVCRCSCADTAKLNSEPVAIKIA